MNTFATEPPPDRRRWAILLVAWLAFFMSFADRLAFSSVSADVGRALGLPVAALGTFVTAFYVGYVVSNVVMGLGGDWLGPRRMLTGSLLGLGVVTVLFGATTTLTAGLALQAAMGLLAGADYASGVKLIAVWFGPLRRGRAMGLFMTATSLAVVVTNLLVPVVSHAAGWPAAYDLLGAATIGTGVLALLVVRDRAGAALPRPEFTLLLRNRQLLVLSLAGFGALWGTWGFAFWASALMRQGYGVPAQQAGFVVALFGIAAIPAKPLIGLVSDWMGGRRRALTAGCLVYFALTLLVFSQADTLTAFEVLGPFLGIGAFTYSPLMNTMVAEAAGPALAASAAGVTNAFWNLGNVIAPSLVGLVFQATNSFQAAFAVLAAGPALGAVCMLFTRETARTAAQPALS